MKLQFSSIIDNIKANKDRTLAIKLETQEMSPEETANIFGQMTKQIWVCMADVPVTPDDLEIPESTAEIGDKTPSQRLRNRMYAYYKETHKDDTGFRAWYENALDKIGNEYLKKINP